MTRYTVTRIDGQVDTFVPAEYGRFVDTFRVGRISGYGDGWVVRTFSTGDGAIVGARCMSCGLCNCEHVGAVLAR